jgi:ankyrin repeat protein
MRLLNEVLYFLRFQDGATAMMIAALSGYEEIVLKLLDRGADVNAVAHVSQIMSVHCIVYFEFSLVYMLTTVS